LALWLPYTGRGIFPAMRAWRVHNFGRYSDELRLEEVPAPAAGPQSAVVRVIAAGVNFADILAIAGRYQHKAELPFTPGTEVAGEVIEAGPGSRLRPGQRVLAMTRAGAFAEYTTIGDEFAHDLPEDVSPSDAAAMLVTYQTSHLALFRRARLHAGEWLLVHGGAGGVGSAAIQLGKRGGARVIATAGGEAKLEVCRSAGADYAIDYREDDFVERVKEITGGRGADVIYDPVGGDVFDGSTKCIAWEGRLLTMGFAGGRIPEIKLNRVLLKNIDVIGVEWPGYYSHAPEILAGIQEDIWAGYRDGSLRPIIWKALPLESVPEALSAIESRESYGKIVIDMSHR
jgi:NADPH2:quinone reductase